MSAKPADRSEAGVPGPVPSFRNEYLLTAAFLGLLATAWGALNPDRIRAQACDANHDCADSRCSNSGLCALSDEGSGSEGPTFYPDGTQPNADETQTGVRTGLVLGGGVIFGASWLGTTATSYLAAAVTENNGIRQGAIPLVGPFLLMAHARGAGETIGLVLVSLAQAAGLTVFTLGFVLGADKQVAVPQTALVPALMGDGGGGLVASGAF